MLVLLAYLFFFISASASPLQRRWLATNRPSQSGQTAFAFRVMLIVALMALVLPLFSPFQLHGDPVLIAGLALACAVFGAGFLILQYSAQAHVDAGLTTLISNIYTPVTIILATLFLGESLKPMQILGTTLLLGSIFLLANKHQVGRLRFDRYFWMMVVNGVMIGFVLTAERSLMKTTGFTAGTLISWWAQALGLGLATLITNSKTNYGTKDTLVTGLLRFFQAISWVTLVNLVGNLSVVSAVTTFKVVVVFVAAAVLLHEREELPRKLVGCLVAVIGLLLMK